MEAFGRDVRSRGQRRKPNSALLWSAPALNVVLGVNDACQAEPLCRIRPYAAYVAIPQPFPHNSNAFLFPPSKQNFNSNGRLLCVPAIPGDEPWLVGGKTSDFKPDLW